MAYLLEALFCVRTMNMQGSDQACLLRMSDVTQTAWVAC
jgi:hypothetical protein